jgi:hypothetical protein
MKRYPGAIAPFWFFAVLGVSFIIQIILVIGLIKIALSFCDSQKPVFSTLFNGFDCFWRYIGIELLCGLIIGGASIACVLLCILLYTVTHSPHFILPVLIAFLILVVILSIKLSLCLYFVVDKGLGPINALRASSRATRGAKWSLFVFGILCGLINILGVLCFFVGLFATGPTVMVAMALVYRNLSEQTPELAELGIKGPNVKPSASGGVGGSTQPFAGMQPNPIIPSIQSIQSGPPAYPKACLSGRGIQLGQGVQLSQGVRLSQSVQPSAGIRPASGIRREGEKKSSNSLLWWVVVLGVCVVIAAGISYYFLARAKGKVVVSPKEAVVSLKEVVFSPKKVALKGILYSEGNSSAIIDGKIVKEGDIINGIKVVKINKDTVEFEKDGERWTQRTK